MAVLVLVAAVASGGCGDRGLTPCPPYPGVGLVVTVVMESSGEPICDAVVTVRREDGGASWTMSADSAQCTYGGTGSGTYSVRAERAGFRPTDVTVRVPSSGGECPVALATPVTIRLVALP